MDSAEGGGLTDFIDVSAPMRAMGGAEGMGRWGLLLLVVALLALYWFRDRLPWPAAAPPATYSAIMERRRMTAGTV